MAQASLSSNQNARKEGGMNTKTIRIIRRIVPAIAWAIAGAVAPAQTWDLASDFQLFPNQGTNGPAETWQYFSLSDSQRDGSYTPLAWYSAPWGGVASLQGWDNVQFSDHSPCIVKNTNSTAVAYGSASIPGGAMYLAPGVPPEWIVVAWKSAMNGSVSLGVGLADIDPNTMDGVQWWLDKGSASGNLAGGTLGVSGNQSTNVSIASVSVVPGDMLFLIMSPLGNVAYDNYRLDFSVTVIPEPAACLGLLAIIPVGIWCARRRGKPGSSE